MPLFGQSESSQDAGQNTQLLSLSQRLNSLEAYNAGNRLGVLEAINSASRLSALESLNAGSRLLALESIPAPTLASLGAEPAGTAAGAITAHKVETDPHIQYAKTTQLPTLASLGAEAAGTAAALIAAHQADPEPHTKFNLRMKCGSTINWGSRWQGEVSGWVSGGTTYDILQQFPSTPLATGTLEPYLYRHERSGNSTITYNIPVRKGTYTVRLHFCENYESNVGARVMSTIKINDITKLTNFDILTQAAKYQALIKEFTNIDCSTTAICKIALSNGLINGIEIIQSN